VLRNDGKFETTSLLWKIFITVAASAATFAATTPAEPPKTSVSTY